MEDLRELKQRFMSLISHELLSPLASMRGYVELVLRTGQDNLTAKQKEHLQISLHNVDRLKDFIDGVLDMTRLHADLFEFEWSEVDVEQVFQQSVAAQKDFLAAKRASIFIKKRGVDAGKVRGDSKRLLRAFGVLLAHALDHTPEGQDILVELGRETPKGKILCSITERGAELSGEETSRLFEEFEATPGPVSYRRFRPHGLNLAVARKIMEKHGGKIWAERLNSSELNGIVIKFLL